MNNQQIEYKRINAPPDIVTRAKEGDAIAQLKLGKMYYQAASVANNDTTAFDWINHSAEQGNMEAQFLLGNLYALGCGTVKSLSDSYKWYTKAAIQGYKKVLIRIYNLYQEDIKMFCRGQINSEEKEWADDYFKQQNKIRELFEYRLEQKKSILNGAIEYYTQKFKHYQSSDQNDPIVQLNLAFLYQHGYGTKKCSRWAFEYYSLSAEQGNSDAQYNLGRLYQQHTDKKFNYREAFKWYTRSAQSGNIAAQRCLAYFYLKGLATHIDYEIAVSWYIKAAEAGDSRSQVTLGMLYRKGDYIKQDLSIAVRWYTLAARQGSIVAQNCLSQLYQRGLLNNIELEGDMLEYLTEDSMNNRLYIKLSAAISKLEDSPEFKQMDKLAKHALIGDGPTMYEIGLRYYHGNKGFSQDKDTGIKWMKKAANREHKDAQFMMAKLYKEGDLIEQDYHKSYIWYKTTAKQKDDVAQYQIGKMYREGLGVRKDPLEASKWFTWAADQQNSDAQFNLGMLRLYGYGIRKDQKQAEEWLYKSVCQRNIQACFQLGSIYFDGDFGFQKHPEMGLKLLEFASKHQQVGAQLFLGDIYKKGRGVKQDIPKCTELYTKAAYSANSYDQYKLIIIFLSDQEYLKAYKLCKKAKNKNEWFAGGLLKIPIEYNPNIKDYSDVIDMFIEVTEKGIDVLAYNIGSIYEHGLKTYYGVQSVDVNYGKAEEWYLVASNNGDSRADYRLGIMYEYGKGVETNITTAIDYYKIAVKKENGDAMYKLACMYLEGYGVIENLLEAFCLYTKASFMGNQEATRALMIFEDNKRVLYDLNDTDYSLQKMVPTAKLINMLEEATEKGYTQLQYQLGVMYDQINDSTKAFKWLGIAADLGITDAHYRLGVLYEKGKGVEQNYSMAASMYQKATEKDHEDASFRLGQLYQHGNGVKIDYLKAYSFYKKAADMSHEMASKVLNITPDTKVDANGDTTESIFDSLSKKHQDSLTMCKYVAEQGDPEIQFKIGLVYEYGYSKPDYKEAFKWYSMAAKSSYKEAMYHLGLLYEKGSGVSQDYQKAIQLYNQAYQLGSDDALHRLGTVYHHGKGVDIDPVKAVECYTLSAKLGNPKYQCGLGRLYEEGELVRKNILEALEWYTKAYLQGYDSISSRLYTIYDDKPYESFFFKKLVRNLSIASCNYFGLNDEYEYQHYSDINNRLGFLHYFGIGTNKDLHKSFQYFMKEYSYRTRTSIKDFGFFEYDDFSFSQKIDVLKELTKDEEYMDQLRPDELYICGMIYYDGVLQTKEISKENEEKGYTPIDEQVLDDPSQHIVIKKDYSKALTLLNESADKSYPDALFQLGMMYHCGHGVKKDSVQGEEYFDLIPRDNIIFMKIAILYHTHNDIQNFSKALKCYKQLGELFIEGTYINAPLCRVANELVQTGLGLLYEYGDGVEQDHQKALDCYKKLIKDYNSTMGNFRLGLIYYYGKGVSINYKRAFDSFGNTVYSHSFKTNFPYVYEKNNLQTSNDIDSEKKLVYCTKTDNEILGETFYYLGLMYKHGQGIPKDEDKAQENFNWALEEGCQRAENEIKD